MKTREASSIAAGGFGGRSKLPQGGPGQSPEKIFEISLKSSYSGVISEARIDRQLSRLSSKRGIHIYHQNIRGLFDKLGEIQS